MNNQPKFEKGKEVCMYIEKRRENKGSRWAEFCEAVPRAFFCANLDFRKDVLFHDSMCTQYLVLSVAHARALPKIGRGVRFFDLAFH